MYMYIIWRACVFYLMSAKTSDCSWNKNKFSFNKYIFIVIFRKNRISERLVYFIRRVHDNIVDVDFLFRVINNSKDVTMYHLLF